MNECVFQSRQHPDICYLNGEYIMTLAIYQLVRLE